MNNGFITLHRKIMEWEWYDDANTFRLFIHLLLKANHAEQNWRGNSIKRGQLITGRKVLADELNLSEQQIRTSISKLISTSEITSKATNKFSLITLVNYSSYQDKQMKATSKTTNKATNEQPTSNQQVTTNNNDNNENNENNKRFIKPSIVEINQYLQEKQITSFTGETFFNHYETNGWMRGKTKIKNWKACVSTWKNNNSNQPQNNTYREIA